MAKIIGRHIDLGVARETVRGTPVAPAFWVPRVEMSFDEKIESARVQSGIGNLDDSEQKHVLTKWAEGDVNGEVRDKAFGLFLYSIFGTCASSVAVDSLYTHTFTLEDTCQHDSLTFTIVDPNSTDQYRLVMLSSLELTQTMDNVLMYTASFMGKTSKGGSGTPAFAVENKFTKKHLSVKLATSIAGLAAATPLSLKELTLTINQNVEPDNSLGTAEPEDFLNKQRTVEGSIELNYEDNTWKEYMRDGSYRAMQIAWTNSDVLVGAASHPALTFQFPRVDFYDWEPNMALDDIVRQTVSFKANYDLTNSLAAISTCTLANTQASY